MYTYMISIGIKSRFLCILEMHAANIWDLVICILYKFYSSITHRKYSNKTVTIFNNIFTPVQSAISSHNILAKYIGTCIRGPSTTEISSCGPSVNDVVR